MLLFCSCVLLCIGSLWFKVLHRGEHCELVSYICLVSCVMDALLVFLSGKHLRYCKSCRISVSLVCLPVSFRSGMSLLPPLMMDWSVGSLGFVMLRYLFLAWLLLIYWLLACSFFASWV